MPIRDYNATPGSNTSLSGIDVRESVMTVASVNDAIRQLMADAKELQAEVSVAYAGTMNIGAANAEVINVTAGSGPTTAFDNVAAGVFRLLRYGVAATVNHGASLLLPGSVNHSFVAGDILAVRSKGAGVWATEFVQRLDGSVVLLGPWALGSDISPTSISTNQNDYNPTGLAGASVIRQAVGTACAITGLAGGSDGRVMVIVNLGSAALTLSDDSASSTAANRFALPGGDITLQTDGVVLLEYDSTSSRWRLVGAPPSTALPRGYIDGFTLSNNGTDATNDIDAAAGSARDDANGNDLTTTATIVKQLDVAFAEYSVPSTASGGRNSADGLADGTWHVFMIGGAGKNTQPFFSTSLAPTLPSGFTFKRRVGSILRTAGAIVGFVQLGDEFLRKASILDVEAANPGTSAVTRTLSIPTGVAHWWIGAAGVFSGTNNVTAYFSALDQNDEAAHGYLATPAVAPGFTVVGGVGVFAWGFSGRTLIRTNTSAQVRSRLSVSGASDRIAMVTYGWVDQRGRNG